MTKIWYAIQYDDYYTGNRRWVARGATGLQGFWQPVDSLPDALHFESSSAAMREIVVNAAETRMFEGYVPEDDHIQIYRITETTIPGKTTRRLSEDLCGPGKFVVLFGDECQTFIQPRKSGKQWNGDFLSRVLENKDALEECTVDSIDSAARMIDAIVYPGVWRLIGIRRVIEESTEPTVTYKEELLA